MQATYLISLLQPAPEVFDLFDDVMLMAGRRIVFHGPKEEVGFILALFGLISLSLSLPVRLWGHGHEKEERNGRLAPVT